MSEEVKNASIIVPQSMVLSIVLNGLAGLGVLIAELFCLGNLDVVLSSTNQYPLIDVFSQATRSTAGSAVMVAIIIFVALGATIGTMAAASRILWAFSRDRGVPGSRFLSKVDSKSSNPINSILCTTILSVLLGLISVWSPVAFNDVISLTLAAFYLSYFGASSLLLWRRCTGSIRTLAEVPPAEDAERLMNLPNSEGKLIWGPWRIPGAFGIAVNAFACVYLVIVFIFSLWPPQDPVEPATMNYSSLVLRATLMFSVIYYRCWAFKTYTGPVIEPRR